MTEAEWLACGDPTPMLVFLHGRVWDRKLRLFACACCRLASRLMRDRHCRDAVEVAERFADGDASEDELRAAQPIIHCDTDSPGSAAFLVTVARYDRPSILQRFGVINLFGPDEAKERRLIEICSSEFRFPVDAASTVASRARNAGHDLDQPRQAALLRDIFGNPFRPVACDPAWRTSAVVALAQGIYDERDFANMPILADALEDAGCDNEDVVAHCRDPKGTHVRGCWVVDLILGKT
jgi:hypothetical protein